MRHIVDYALKFVLLFFIFARFLGGPAPEAHAAPADPVHEPSKDTTSNQ
jgi:hypothetical protein